MKPVAWLVAVCLSMIVTAFCHAQPAPSSTQSAKEQRQPSSSKPRPDRSQAEAKKIKDAQKEAKELQDRKMDAASTELSMGVASGAGQIGATAGKRKTEKLHIHKDAVKKDAIKVAK